MSTLCFVAGPQCKKVMIDFCFLWLLLLLYIYYNTYIEPRLFPLEEREQYAEERILFYPTLAVVRREFSPERGAEVDFAVVCVNGIIFAPVKSFSRLRGLARRFFQTMLGPKGSAETELFRRRVAPLVGATVRPGKRITVSFSPADGTTESRYTLTTLSQTNGRFSEQIKIPLDQVKPTVNHQSIIFRSLPQGGQQATFVGEAILMKEEGVSIISDIDDTIKLSYVADKRQLLKCTFTKEYEVVPGMSALYRRWAHDADLSPTFHYVSGSPWAIWEALREEFFERFGFPKGSIHLRNFRWREGRTVIELFASPYKFKKKIIEPMLRQFPKRKFIFVGDTSEADPEVYGDLARAYPDQVRAIFIRRAFEKPKKAKKSKSPFKAKDSSSPLVVAEISALSTSDNTMHISESLSEGTQQAREERLERERQRWAVAFKGLTPINGSDGAAVPVSENALPLLSVYWKVFDDPQELLDLPLAKMITGEEWVRKEQQAAATLTEAPSTLLEVPMTQEQ